MKTILSNASINFLLVSVPVSVAGTIASETKRGTQTKTLHKECLTPIEQPKTCPVCNTLGLSADDLVKGVKVNGKYEVVDLSEVDEEESDSAIEIHKFIPEGSIGFLLNKANHYLMPSVRAKEYEVLVTALAKRRELGLGVHKLWGKETPCTVQSWGGLLLLTSLHVHEDLQSATPIEAPPLPGVKELEMAYQIMDAMGGVPEPEDLSSATRDRKERIIASQLRLEAVAGRLDQLDPPDLMMALKASVALLPKQAKVTA